ncbi:MAG: ATP-binding cassette domain-containing protein [Clostridia bacterium]|nr:ATP-binding cassette domain-containing protein [Clostridia bacterium]
MILKADSISKRYFRPTGQANYFEAVKPLSLTLASGAVTVLMGRSGSGKTTLLHMLSGLLTPTSGKVLLDETDLYSLKDGALSCLRNEKIAVVPQGRSAVDTLTALENILLPWQLCRKNAPVERAEHWMEALGIAALRDVPAKELSGGELRRAAIARALCQETPVLMADEPTGDLDDENTRLALSILKDAAKRENKTVLIVTHESEARAFADEIWKMDGGTLHPEQ